MIHYPHINVLTPTSELCCKILNMMCLHAAQVLIVKQGGFEKCRLSNPPLKLLTNDELTGLPTNNLESESHLVKFGKQAAVAKFRNQRFKAKGIRNDFTFLFKLKLERFSTVVKLLNEMEQS